MTLDIAANLAEILAGLAIVIAAIKAWPVFSTMSERFSSMRRDGPDPDTHLGG